MSNATAGFSTVIKYAIGTVIGEMNDIGGIKLKAESIDVTNHQSPNGFKEFIAGLKDGGEFPIQGNFVAGDAGQLALAASFESGATESFIVTFPDGTEWAFSAVVTGIEIGKADMKGQISFGATLKISGKPVMTGPTALYTITFHVTAAAGGAAIAGAVVVFNGETKTTDAGGLAAFANVAAGAKTYGVTKATYTGQAVVQTVSANATVSIALVAA